MLVVLLSLIGLILGAPRPQIIDEEVDINININNGGGYGGYGGYGGNYGGGGFNNYGNGGYDNGYGGYGGYDY